MPLIICASYSDVLTTLFFDPSQPLLTTTSTFPSGGSMSWISIAPNDPRLLIGTNETDDGEVRAFKLTVEGNGVEFTELGVQKTGGSAPAHHLVVEDGSEVLAANYMSGTLQTVPLVPTISPPVHPLLKFPFIGPGPNPSRQESSHPHQVYQRSADEIIIPDLGADKIWRLGRTPQTGGWTIKGSIASEPGSGPRHVQVVGTDLYVLNELSNTLTHFTLPTSLEATASHQSTQPCTLLPTPPGAGAAELMIHPQGTYLYATNRDSKNVAGDTIAIFSLSTSLLKLGAKEPKWVKEVHTGLQHIRGAVIKEFEGKTYIVAAGSKGGGVKAFEVTEGGEDLKEIAQTAVEQVTGFVWI